MPHPLKKILVPVDFNVPSRAALTLAHDLAAALGGSIDILHVIDLPPGGAFASEAYVPVPASYREEIERRVSARLAEWLETTSAPAGVTHHVVDGKPAQQIVRYASDQRIDLIVMGTHSRTGVSHMVAGSVAESVVRTAHCPVVTVRGPKPEA